MFKDAIDAENIILPQEFAELLNNGTTEDSFCLERFVKAQEQMYAIALQEIEQGQKWSHWIWYIFPQLAVLGHSRNAKYYGLSGYDEAEAYLNHPVLGCRLREITQALLQHKELTAEEILGGIDAMKVKSSMTLFAEVSPDDIFDEVLKVFYNGSYDKLTLDLMQSNQKTAILLIPSQIGDRIIRSLHWFIRHFKSYGNRVVHIAAV